MDDTTKSLPSNYNQGYCYFDVNTKKFWIDTAPDNATAEQKQAGRVPINALRADIADVGVRLPFGTCTTASATETKIINVGQEAPWTGSKPASGTMLAVYFENENTADAPNLQLSAGNGASIDPVYLRYNKRAGSGIAKSWGSGTVIIFTYMAAVSGVSTAKWVMADYQDLSAVYDYVDQQEPLIVGTQNSATASWTGVAPFAELKNGQRILYWLPQNAGTGNITLNLTLSDNTTTGAKSCYQVGTVKLSNSYRANSLIPLVYRTNVPIGNSSYSGWWTEAGTFYNFSSESGVKSLLYETNTLPSLSHSNVSIPNVTSVGTLPTYNDISVKQVSTFTTNTPTSANVTGCTLKITLGSAAALDTATATVSKIESAGTLPTLGTALSASKINSWNQGTAAHKITSYVTHTVLTDATPEQ